METLEFFWQEAIDGLGVGKDMGKKLCFQKLNLTALDVDWSRKRQRWGDQLRSREDRAKT